MARVFTAKKNKAGKDISCRKCQKKIAPGDTYKYYFRRFSSYGRGTKCIHCSTCKITHSDQSSSKMAEIYDARDAIQVSDASGWPDALRDLASTVESVKDEYESNRSNMPDHLQDVGTGAEMQEKIDALESYAQELEQAADEIEGELHSFDEPTSPDDVAHDEECSDKDDDDCSCAHGDAHRDYQEWETNSESQDSEFESKANDALDSLSI